MPGISAVGSERFCPFDGTCKPCHQRHRSQSKKMPARLSAQLCIVFLVLISGSSLVLTAASMDWREAKKLDSPRALQQRDLVVVDNLPNQASLQLSELAKSFEARTRQQALMEAKLTA